MKPGNKAIKEIFDMDNCLEWDMEFEEVFGGKGYMFCWRYDKMLELIKKYPQIEKTLGLDCYAFKEAIEKNVRKTGEESK